MGRLVQARLALVGVGGVAEATVDFLGQLLAQAHEQAAQMVADVLVRQALGPEIARKEQLAEVLEQVDDAVARGQEPPTDAMGPPVAAVAGENLSRQRLERLIEFLIHGKVTFSAQTILGPGGRRWQ